LARARDRVELRAAVVVARTPGAFDQPLLLEAEERGVDGALIERQDAAGHLFDSAGDAVAVQRAQRPQRLQHEEIESAIWHVGERGHVESLQESLLTGNRRR